MITHERKEKNHLFSNKIKFYLQISYLGVLRGGFGLIVEHPLESIKTQWQDQISIKNASEIIKYVYRKKGLIGFYRGFIPNFIRMATRQVYRWPMMIFFPKLFQTYLPEKLRSRFDGLHKILAGLAIANIELFIITPLDRLKIYFMTVGEKKGNLLRFFRENRRSITRELFRGFEPTFWRGNVSWISFLYLDYYFKKIFKKIRNTEYLGFHDLIIISFCVGLGNVLAVMPFDFAKTQIQKNGYSSGSTIPLLIRYYREHGLKTLYTGWKIRSLQYVINSIFTVMTLERLELKSKKI